MLKVRTAIASGSTGDEEPFYRLLNMGEFELPLALRLPDSYHPPMARCNTRRSVWCKRLIHGATVVLHPNPH